MQPGAVMVMAYGGPDCLDAVGPFMCELTGREPAGEMLARIQARYNAIGGKSPLPEIAAQFASCFEGASRRGRCGCARRRRFSIHATDDRRRT